MTRTRTLAPHAPRHALLLAALVGLLTGAAAAAAPLAPVAGGSYLPFYPVDGEGVHEIAAFELHTRPVTNADFLEFVRQHPEWDVAAPPEVFADPAYLAHWEGPGDLGEAHPDAPVTHVSWFAAGAYCESAGLRLPSEDEWEVAARADATREDATGDPTRTAELLALYGAGRAPSPVAQDEPNVFGLHDLHGNVWEWVEDPWSTISMSDSRNEVDDDIARVCGGASLGARDRTDYPAFLRHATRSGLDPASVGSSLGFRCAR